VTLLVQKVDAVACIVQKADAVAHFVRKANALPISVWCAYAWVFLVRRGMCADTYRLGAVYLARLRSERLDVSVAYLASGRSPCIRTQNFFSDAERPDALDPLDVSDATCLTRTQIAMAPCIWTQLAMASAYWTECGRVFSFWTLLCQGIFLLNGSG